jgi:hypothetical protein
VAELHVDKSGLWPPLDPNEVTLASRVNPLTQALAAMPESADGTQRWVTVASPLASRWPSPPICGLHCLPLAGLAAGRNPPIPINLWFVQSLMLLTKDKLFSP